MRFGRRFRGIGVGANTRDQRRGLCAGGDAISALKSQRGRTENMREGAGREGEACFRRSAAANAITRAIVGAEFRRRIDRHPESPAGARRTARELALAPKPVLPTNRLPASVSAQATWRRHLTIAA